MKVNKNNIIYICNVNKNINKSNKKRHVEGILYK